MMFILKWPICYALIMFAMCLDNICWIPSSPEWPNIRKNFWIFVFWKHEFGIPKNKEGLKYCWKNRILEVIKHPRDIIPGIIASFLLALW